jgi:putative ATPase
VSRSTVFQFEPLDVDEIRQILDAALNDRERGLGSGPIEIDDEALNHLANVCDGDARQALSVLETAAMAASDTERITIDAVREAIAHRAVQYDASGDEHYDCVSALIKSIRGSDPDAGIYWLARMLEAGEEIRFLCRRLIILSSEDIGNADPAALPLAVACSQACEQIGLPECQLNLAQTVTYLACAPKSNASTVAVSEAKQEIRDGRILTVPRHLRDAHYAGAAKLGHGEGYRYSHNEPDGIAAQDYLGIEREFYRPVDRGFESELRQRLVKIRKKLRSEKNTEVDS